MWRLFALISVISLTARELFLLMIERAAHADARPVEHMGVDHGRAYVLVAQQFLNSTNVISVLQKMRCEGMSKCVASRWFVYSRFPDRLLHHAL